MQTYTRITGIALALSLAACAMPEMPEAPEGALLFADHCAACHGANAAGAGPETLGLGKVPPDLTALARANAGVFPTASVLSTIDGYAKGTHVDRAMPEFGAELGGDLVPLEVDGVLTPTPRALVAILRYLESVQAE